MMNDGQRWSLAVPALAFVILAWVGSAAAEAETVDLAGTWRFRIDRDDRGVAEHWQAGPLAGGDTVTLPGAMQSQGHGDPVSVNTAWTGEIVDRSWFTAPEYEAYRRAGPREGAVLAPARAALRRRGVVSARARRPRRVAGAHAWSLTLERPHIETRAWLDDRELGTSNSLSTPHEYDLGTAVAPGRHRLTIRVDNRLELDVGINSHSVTDHTQGNWNGIVGRIALAATSPVWVADLQVIPHDASRSITVRCTDRQRHRARQARYSRGSRSRLRERRSVRAAGVQPRLAGRGQRTTFTDGVSTSAADAPRWDEFHPALYRVTASDRRRSGGLADP